MPETNELEKTTNLSAGAGLPHFSVVCTPFGVRP
jgi:hypothetical protein